MKLSNCSEPKGQWASVHSRENFILSVTQTGEPQDEKGFTLHLGRLYSCFYSAQLLNRYLGLNMCMFLCPEKFAL